jgi:hypothetical protein
MKFKYIMYALQIALFVSGTWLLIVSSSWQTWLAVFMLLWSNNFDYMKKDR